MKKTETKRKLNELIMLNVLLTIFVVLIHSLSEAINDYEPGTIANLLVFVLQKSISFVVPGFIFLSSFKLFYSLDKTSRFNYSEFVFKRVKNVLLPYIVIAIIYYLYNISEGITVFNMKDLFISLFLKGDISVQFYFIIIIFQFYLLMPLFKLISKKNSVFILVIASFIISSLVKFYLPYYFGSSQNALVKFYLTYTDRIFLSYIFYWSLGIYFGLNYAKIREKLLNNSFLISIIYIAIASVHIILSYKNYMGSYYYKYGEIGQLIFCSISIIWFYLISLKSKVFDLYFVNKFKMAISETSYYIYLIHVLVIHYLDILINEIQIDKLYIRFMFRFIFTVLISYILSKLILKISSAIKVKLRYIKE